MCQGVKVSCNLIFEHVKRKWLLVAGIVNDGFSSRYRQAGNELYWLLDVVLILSGINFIDPTTTYKQFIDSVNCDV